MSLTPRLKPRPLSSIPAAVSTVTRTYVTYSTSKTTPTVVNSCCSIHSHPYVCHLLHAQNHAHCRQFLLQYPQSPVRMSLTPRLKPRPLSSIPAAVFIVTRTYVTYSTFKTTPTVVNSCCSIHSYPYVCHLLHV